MCITFGTPDERVGHFQQSHLNFDIQTIKIEKASMSCDDQSDPDGFQSCGTPCHFVYACRKMETRIARIPPNRLDSLKPAASQRTAVAQELSTFMSSGTVKQWSYKGFGFIKIDAPIQWPVLLPGGSGVYVSRENVVSDRHVPASLV